MRVTWELTDTSRFLLWEGSSPRRCDLSPHRAPSYMDIGAAISRVSTLRKISGSSESLGDVTMNFERHWRQRVAVALGRGQALIVTQSCRASSSQA
eukprot:COSAG05_NODE_1294_length_5255_cov_3.346974_7_plen_96_part_00